MTDKHTTYDYGKHGQAMTLDEKLAFFEAYKKAMGHYPDPYGEEGYKEMLEEKANEDNWKEFMARCIEVTYQEIRKARGE